MNHLCQAVNVQLTELLMGQPMWYDVPGEVRCPNSSSLQLSFYEHPVVHEQNDVDPNIWDGYDAWKWY